MLFELRCSYSWINSSIGSGFFLPQKIATINGGHKRKGHYIGHTSSRDDLKRGMPLTLRFNFNRFVDSTLFFRKTSDPLSIPRYIKFPPHFVLYLISRGEWRIVLASRGTSIPDPWRIWRSSVTASRAKIFLIVYVAILSVNLNSPSSLVLSDFD